MTKSLPRRGFLQATGAAATTTLFGAATAATKSTPSPLPKAFAQRVDVKFKLNGSPVAAQLEPRVTLLDYLRETAALPGTKKGCNEGACGACTVLLDGKRVNACLALAVACDGADIVTVEGLVRPDGTLHPVQEAFIANDAFQCGYCTPGQVMSAVACIREGHSGNSATVREWMSGNLCRCAAYPQITAAVLDAASRGAQ